MISSHECAGPGLSTALGSNIFLYPFSFFLHDWHTTQHTDIFIGEEFIAI